MANVLNSWRTPLLAALLTALLGLDGCLTLGCSAEWWTGKTTMRTELSGPGWSFIDTKDNDIAIEGAEYDAQTHSFKLPKLTVRNNASGPIAAEVARIEAIGAAQMSQVAYLTGVMQGLASIVGAAGQAAPGFAWLRPPAGGGSLSVPTPWGELGGTTGATPAWASPYSAEEQQAFRLAQIEAARLQAEYQLKLLELLKTAPQPSAATQPAPE